MRIFALLLLAVCCTAIRITDPQFSFSSQVVETHLVIQQDASKAANAGIELTVTLTGTGAPVVTPEEVLSVTGGSVEVRAAKPNGQSNDKANAGSASHPLSPFLLSIVIGVLGMLTGFRFRYLGLVVVSIACLMGGSIALTQFDPSWKLTVIATVPSSVSLTSFNVNILRGSVTMTNGSLAVASSASLNLCDNGGNGDANFINFDGSSLSLSGLSSFCATKKVILQNVVIPKGASIKVTSLQESGYVFVKDSFAGVFDVSGKQGYAISTACSDRNFSQSEPKVQRGSCGVQLINGTAAATEAKVNITGFYDAVFAVAEGITAITRSAKRWSDPATWGGQIPQNGTDVVISKDAVIMLDVTTASLNTLEIRGTLIADQQSDFWVTASSIQLYGTLRVGSVYEPYTRKGGFTMTGPKGVYTSRAPLLGWQNSGYSRVLMAQPDSNLLLYSALPRNSYTRLNDNAAQNSTILTVDSVDGWKAGDLIAISPTTFPSTSQTDTRTIVAVNAQTRQITIDKGLSYARWGKLQYATDQGISLQPGTFEKYRAHPEVPDVIDERAVIVHLTRNIVINSPNDSDWQAGHGVHVMWMGPRTQVQLSGVEVYRAGQQGALGRYPLHAHMVSYNMINTNSLTDPSDGTFVGDATGVFVRNCAVHNSVNRAYTLHAICGARYENNVANDIEGHAFFLEDGSEIRNHIIGNVMLNVHRPIESLRLLRHDEQSSGFWFTNGNNHFRDNIAGDIRDGFGIWNSFTVRPMPSYNVTSKPDSMTFAGYPDMTKMPLESWTLTCINATHWSAEGSVRGKQNTSVVVGSRYQNGFIDIQIDGTASAGSKMVIKIDGYAGGCLGQSRNIPLHPQFTPMLDYSNNTAFACARGGITTDNANTDEFGSPTGSTSFVSTSDSLPTNDIHNGPTRVPTHFNMHRIWMNEGGGYSNRIYNPLYTRWIGSNNNGKDLSGATQVGRLQNSLFVGNSLNRLESKLYDGPRHAFSTYHFSIEFFNISFFNYPPNTKPYKTGYNLLDMNGVIDSWDLYLHSVEDGPMGKLMNWKQFNCSQFERTPPANIELTYANSSGGPDVWPYRYFTLSGAMYDNGGVFAGRHGDYLIFDDPFFTYNLPDVRPVAPGSKTLATSAQFYGVYLKEADPDTQRADWAPIAWNRLNDKTLAVEGKWEIGDGSKAIFLGHMRHASIVKGGVYKMFNHVTLRPNKQRYTISIYNPDKQNNASVVMGMPWDRSTPATVKYWDATATQVDSFSLMRATPLSFFQESSTDIVWYNHVMTAPFDVTISVRPK